ncbi:hypothetical protein FRB90_003712 [Tulasnella sp. 427]|nr:hypothetical protein FRB90_003712 [Tulasnella sp. 427]
MNQQRALEDMVVEVCTAHKSAHQAEQNYRAAVNIETNYFVKFGHSTDLLPEIATQKYLSDYATSNPGPGVPRIPRVLHSFQRGWTAYLVMEFLQLQPTSNITDEVTAALVWLAGVPPPSGHVLGPLGGGRIRHGFFKDAKAPLPFSSVKALQRYMNEAYALLSTRNKQVAPSVNIQDDRLMFSQSDMDSSNFGLDEQGKTVLLDFAEIGWLPATFVAHTLSSPGFARTLAALGLSNKSNVSMSSISSVLQMMAYPKLGLDKDGNKQATR